MYIIDGVQGIIDSHTHRYPREVIEDPVSWGEARGESYWASVVSPGGVQGWADRDRMLRDMDAAGVEKAVLQGWYWEHQSTCDEQNRWHARWIQEDPDRFIALASIQPRDGQKAVDGFREALDSGCVGIGELHPWVQGWPLDCVTWEQIAAICEEGSLPVCFHTTEAVGRNYKGYVGTPMSEYFALIRRHPNLKMIFAHWGGGMPFFALNKWASKAMSNIWYDTSASPLVYSSRIWRCVVDMAGSGRILFGTDYPLLFHPSQSREPSFSCLVDEAVENLPKESLDAVMRENALALFPAS